MNFPEFWQNFDRILMWKVRMVRSVADRTFQPRSKRSTAAAALRKKMAEEWRQSLPSLLSLLGLKGSVRKRPNHSNFFRSEFGQNSSEFRKSSQNSSEIFWNLRNSQHFLKNSAKFREIFVRIGAKFDENGWKIAIFYKNLNKNMKKFAEILLKFWILSGAKVCKTCRSRKMLSNEYLLAKIGADTEENEPSKVWPFLVQNSMKIV